MLGNGQSGYKVLVLREPWLWLIAYSDKTVENRTWSTHFRGKVLLSSSNDVRRTYDHAAVEFAYERGVQVPTPDQLAATSGGINAIVTVTDCVRHHRSRWAMPDQFHWILADRRPLPFVPIKGRLGLFDAPPELIQQIRAAGGKL